MGGVGLGGDDKPGRILVQPMHDAGTLDAADARQAFAAMADEGVDEGALAVAGRRMDDEAGGLDDHDEMRVLEDDVERQSLRPWRRSLRAAAE